MIKNHPFHMVSYSPWPLLSSMTIFSSLVELIKNFHFNYMMKMNMNLLLSILLTVLVSLQWWRDIGRESTIQGEHTQKVKKGIKLGMMMFILSEIMFFSSFFWAFFHSSLTPSPQMGLIWPPKSIQTFNPTEIPLLNTIILLSSGASITWAHQNMMNNKLKETKKAIFLTIILGIYFSTLQMWEYEESKFSISDSIYGTTFFMATGFHGIHVMIGTTFIMMSLFWTTKLHQSKMNHNTLELASWYWHFVDVIWMFLYISIYWWGSN